jgi:hypothetical protein
VGAAQARAASAASSRTTHTEQPAPIHARRAARSVDTVGGGAACCPGHTGGSSLNDQ